MRPLHVLLLAVFVDVLDIGLFIPIAPLLLADPRSPYLLLEKDQIGTGYVLLGLLGAAYAVGAFLAAPVLGQLADRHGRRPLLAVSLGGTAVGYAIFALGVGLGSIPLLFLGRLIDGLTGGNVAVAQAAIADLTPKEKRPQVFGYFSAAASLGFVVGPLLGGFLSDSRTAEWLSPAAPLWAAAALSALNALLILGLLPETLRERREEKLTPSRAFTNVRNAFGDDTLRAAYLTLLMFTAGFTFFTTFFNVFTIERLGFDQRAIGVFFSVLGLCLFGVDSFLVERTRKRFGSVAVLRVVLLGTGAALLLTATVGAAWQLFALAPLLAVTIGLIRPNLNGLISGAVPENDQGRVLGIGSSVQSLGEIVPPLLAGPLAALAGPAAPVVVGGASVLAAAGAFFALYRNRPEPSPEPAA